MLWISPAQLAAYLRIKALPEPRQVAGGLHRPLVRREQVYHQRNFAIRDARRFAHPKEILQTRRDPRGFARLVMYLGLASVGQSDMRRRKFAQTSGIRSLL